MKKAVILDFDGTLANTAHVLQKVYNDMAEQKGWPIMSSNDYTRLRKGTMREAIAWSGVSLWQLPWLLHQGRTKFFEEIDDVSLFTGMKEAVTELNQAGWDVFILSKNSQKAVQAVVDTAGLTKKVTVLPRASFFGKHRNLRRFIRDYRYEPENMWMVGDEVKDIEAATKVNIRSIAVVWGLQDESILKKNKPNYIAHEPTDITDILC